MQCETRSLGKYDTRLSTSKINEVKYYAVCNVSKEQLKNTFTLVKYYSTLCNKVFHTDVQQLCKNCVS